MALAIGDITASSGLAKRIFDNFIANSSACGFGASPPAAAQTMLKAQAYCIAKAVVEEIQANAAIASGAVTVTIPSTQGGLQKSTAAGVLTDPPGADKTLLGTCTGSIT